MADDGRRHLRVREGCMVVGMRNPFASPCSEHGTGCPRHKGEWDRNEIIWTWVIGICVVLAWVLIIWAFVHAALN